MRQRRTDTSLNEGGKVIGVTAVNSVREEGCLPLRYSICAYLRLRRKSEGDDAILLPFIVAERKHAVSRRRARGLSLNITTFFRVSSRKKV